MEDTEGALSRLQVTAARTALILRLDWSPDGAGPVESNRARADGLCARTFPTRPGAAKPVWEPHEDTPFGIDELDPMFRAVIGNDGRDSPWRAVWLRAARHVTDGILGDAEVVDAAGKVRFRGPRIENVDLALFPLATGALVFHLDWRAAGGASLTVAELVERLAAICRIRGGSRGWRFGTRPSEAQLAHLPARLRGAFGDGAGAALAELADWLLLQARDPVDAPPLRTGTTRHAVHQTALVTGEAPSPAELDRALFHLRRAVPETHQPPPEPGADRVLATAGNRRIAISRDGCVHLAWPAGSRWNEGSFDTDDLPRRFAAGVYLRLALHTLAERRTLATLSEEAQGRGAYLDDIESVAARREDLFELARRAAQYSLSMVGDDPGGRAQYAAFFGAVREVLGIPAQLAEVRAKVSELFELVETAQQWREADFQAKIAGLGAYAVPFGILCGLLGINPPPGFGLGAWLALVGGTTVASGVIALTVRGWVRRRPRLSRQERRRLGPGAGGARADGGPA